MAVAISTSRSPSQRTRTLCRELQRMLPSALYIQRGKQSLTELIHRSIELESHSLILIGERDGNPGSLTLYTMELPDNPILTLRIRGVKLAREHRAHSQTPSKTLSLTSGGSETAHRLAKRLQPHLVNASDSKGQDAGENRILSIMDEGEGSLRLIFRDSIRGVDLGPSLKVSWE